MIRASRLFTLAVPFGHPIWADGGVKYFEQEVEKRNIFIYAYKSHYQRTKSCVYYSNIISCSSIFGLYVYYQLKPPEWVWWFHEESDFVIRTSISLCLIVVGDHNWVGLSHPQPSKLQFHGMGAGVYSRVGRNTR